MLLVVDANILIAALIRDGYTRHMLLFGDNEYCIPEYIFEETKNHLNELAKRTKVPNEELWKTMQDLISQANAITPDQKDIHYVALALKQDCPIWSNDKKLKEQNKVVIITTEELSRNPSF